MAYLNTIWQSLKNNTGAFQAVGAIFQSIGAVAIPFILLWAGQSIKQSEEQRTEQLRKQQEEQARTARGQAAVANYFNQLTTLLAQSNLTKKPEIQTFLTASTSALLQNPDIQDTAEQHLSCSPNADKSTASSIYSHREMVIKHLSKAALIQTFGSADKPVISLQGLKSPGLSNLCFSGIDFSGADLSRTNFQNTNLSKANLTRADLRGANLSNANLEAADMTRAKLGEIKSPSDCGDCGGYLLGADLTKANLQGAKLNEADLSDTDLDGADLIRANLSGADLRNSNVTEEQLKGALLCKTQLPQTSKHDPNRDCSILKSNQPSFQSDIPNLKPSSP